MLALKRVSFQAKSCMIRSAFSVGLNAVLVAPDRASVESGRRQGAAREHSRLSDGRFNPAQPARACHRLSGGNRPGSSSRRGHRTAGQDGAFPPPTCGPVTLAPGQYRQPECSHADPGACWGRIPAPGIGYSAWLASRSVRRALRRTASSIILPSIPSAPAPLFAKASRIRRASAISASVGEKTSLSTATCAG
jgi:hypothetical protein